MSESQKRKPRKQAYSCWQSHYSIMNRQSASRGLLSNRAEWYRIYAFVSFAVNGAATSKATIVDGFIAGKTGSFKPVVPPPPRPWDSSRIPWQQVPNHWIEWEHAVISRTCETSFQRWSTRTALNDPAYLNKRSILDFWVRGTDIEQFDSLAQRKKKKIDLAGIAQCSTN